VVATHLVPRLADVTQIPDASWEGWAQVLAELQVDANDQVQAGAAIARCQNMLTSLVQAAMQSGQQQAAGGEHHHHHHQVRPLAGCHVAARDASVCQSDCLQHRLCSC
jgi:hypothetical protein